MCVGPMKPYHREVPIAEYQAELERERRGIVNSVVRAFEKALDGTETEDERRQIFDHLWRREGTYPFRILELIDKLGGEHAPDCKVTHHHPGGFAPYTRTCCRGAF